MNEIFYGDSPLVKEWMAARFGQVAPARAHSTIALVRNGQIRGAVWLENYNGASVMGHVVGDGRRWLTKEFMRAVYHYIFNVLQCKKILGVVREVNLEARRFDEHIGFRQECVIADADPEGALIVYSMRREDCKYLEENHG